MAIAAYADRVATLSGSAVREILKLTQQPDMISFGGGMPSEDAFPTEDLKRIMSGIVANLDGEVLQYGVTEGYLKLREEIVKMMAAKGVETKADNVLITSGSQQGIDLVARAFLNKGDKVVVESPTYLSAIQVFKLYEADLIPVAVDEDGILPGELQKIFDTYGEAVKLVYMVPTFQNPTGKAMPLARRQEILSIVNQQKVVLIEDDPYGDLRYSGEAIPNFASLDKEGQVLYLGSFSKVVAPGLRVGYAIADEAILGKMIIGKQANDVHTPMFSQMVIAQYLQEGLLAGHLAEINAMYRKKRDEMLRCLEAYMPAGVKWTHPDGGLFIWLELPEGMSSNELFLEAVKEKVAFVAGDSFFAHGEVKNAMRLNFSNATWENIEIGIKKLAEVIQKNA